MSSSRHRHGAGRTGLPALAVLLALGLAVRLLLVLVVYPGQGFSSDMDLFIQWGRGLLQRGPADFYSGDGSANYPPLAIWMFGGLSALSGLFGGDSAAVLVKLPGAVADVAVAAVVHRLIAARTRPVAALAGAAITLAIPVFWYDSTLWGQVDSILVLLSLVALALLIEDHPVAAMTVAMAAWLFKPQGVLVLLVVATVIVVAVVRRGVDAARIGPLPRTSRAPTLVLAIGAAVASVVVVVVPFDYERLATGPLAGLPGIGDVAGLLQQNLSTAALFPVLSANAFNVWALVGDPSLASSISGRSAVWYVDAVPVLGIPAASLGLAALGAVVLAVVAGLWIRQDGTAILFAFTLLAVAFFGFPTRVHERYLVGAFATMIVLAADSVVRLGATVLLSVVNTVNLHAVLAGGPGVSVVQAGSRAVAGGGIAERGRSGRIDVLAGAPTQRDALDHPGVRTVLASRVDHGLGPPTAGEGGPTVHAAYIALPWGEAARQEWVVVLCSVAQTAASVVLLVGWIVLIARDPVTGARTRSSARPQPHRSTGSRLDS